MAADKEMTVTVGENLKGTLKGDKLILEIDLKQRLRKSQSGKTVLVATTGGNVAVAGTPVKIGINAYVPFEG